MTTAGYKYLVPRSEAELAAVLAEPPHDHALLGGGTTLVPDLSTGTARPARVVDLRLAGLDGISRDGDDLVLGGRVSYRDVLDSPEAADVPLLGLMARGITGGAQIVGQGTLGGSACYANPSSDVPGALVAVRAEVELASVGGIRRLPAQRFFLGAFRTALRHDEYLARIRIPARRQERAGYYKLKHSNGSWPIVTAACVLSDAGGTTTARVAIGGATATPFVIEMSLAEADGDAAIAAVGDAARPGVDDEWTDVLAGAGYRRAVTAAVARRAVMSALGRETHG